MKLPSDVVAQLSVQNGWERVEVCASASGSASTERLHFYSRDEDINECLQLNETKCNRNARCINMNGSYACECLAGYSGNGIQCKDVNECNLDEYPCDNHATCTNNIGSFRCACDAGWTGNGTFCTDINECNTTQCAGNATCHNYPGTYRCICNRGYKGDGFKRCESLGCMPPPYCIGEFRASWWARPPYLSNSSKEEPAGLFRDLLLQVVAECCNNCSQLKFDAPLNGSFELEALIEANSTDFGCPLYGAKDQTYFRGFPFMPVVESPGIAFFIKEQPKEQSALLGSLGSSWPILAITFLLACLSGVIIWFLDTVKNPTEFPNSFIAGSWEGFWWAFITMTTVGYGDKAPRSFSARLFGIVWILIGLVIISTFTATITTMLTASSLSNEVKLYGTRVGALHNSEDYRLGVKRNAEVKSYASVPEIIKRIEDDTVQGILIDSYIAGEFQDQLMQYRLHQIIDYVFSYGVVLGRDGLALQKCFRNFLESKQSQIYATVSNIVKPLKENKRQSAAVEKSENLFDASSPYFRYTVFFGLGLFVILLGIGILWEFLRWRERKKHYQLANLNEQDRNDTELLEWRVEWESGEVSHFHKNIFKTDIADLKKQIREFADNWVDKLDDLETKQKKELERIKRQNEKRAQSTNSRQQDENRNENKNGVYRP